MQCANGNMGHENQEEKVVVVSNLYRYLPPLPKWQRSETQLKARSL
jgi:hypothetical protein